MAVKKSINKFVIGVDGGGTKTAVALADMEGKIISRARAGGARPRDIGIPAAAKNITDRDLRCFEKGKGTSRSFPLS